MDGKPLCLFITETIFIFEFVLFKVKPYSFNSNTLNHTEDAPGILALFTVFIVRDNN